MHSRYKEEVFSNVVIKPQEQVAQRGDRCSIPVNIQGQVRWISEQSGLVEDDYAYCRCLRLNDL